MSKRLLVSKTDNDNERQLIAKLKMKMGAPYTSKLEGMIVDKGLSAETQKNFLDYCRAQDVCTIPPMERLGLASVLLSTPISLASLHLCLFITDL